MATTDDTDRTLIGLLRENARAPTAELGRRLGLARTTVQSRIEKLERMGVIAGYTVRTGDAYEAAQVRAQVMIAAPPRATPRIEAALRRMPEVRRLASIAGAFDLMAEVAAPSVAALDAAIDRIGAVEGVERTQSAVVLSLRIDR
jgi:DNA-binding Lrp family transcriptional regulator